MSECVRNERKRQQEGERESVVKSVCHFFLSFVGGVACPVKASPASPPSPNPGSDTSRTPSLHRSTPCALSLPLLLRRRGGQGASRPPWPCSVASAVVLASVARVVVVVVGVHGGHCGAVSPGFPVDRRFVRLEASSHVHLLERPGRGVARELLVVQVEWCCGGQEA